METVYLLNATNNPNEYGSYASSYTDLIFNVLYLLANGSVSDSPILETEKAKLFTTLQPKLMAMFAFEADLANVSTSFAPLFLSLYFTISFSSFSNNFHFLPPFYVFGRVFDRKKTFLHRRDLSFPIPGEGVILHSSSFSLSTTFFLFLISFSHSERDRTFSVK